MPSPEDDRCQTSPAWGYCMAGCIGGLFWLALIVAVWALGC